MSGIFRGKVGEFPKMFSTILGNWEEKSVEKTFWSAVDVPLPKLKR